MKLNEWRPDAQKVHFEREITSTLETFFELDDGILDWSTDAGRQVTVKIGSMRNTDQYDRKIRTALQSTGYEIVRSSGWTEEEDAQVITYKMTKKMRESTEGFNESDIKAYVDKYIEEHQDLPKLIAYKVVAQELNADYEGAQLTPGDVKLVYENGASLQLPDPLTASQSLEDGLEGDMDTIISQDDDDWDELEEAVKRGNRAYRNVNSRIGKIREVAVRGVYTVKGEDGTVRKSFTKNDENSLASALSWTAKEKGREIVSEQKIREYNRGNYERQARDRYEKYAGTKGKIHFSTKEAAALWDKELTGQISDGMYENSSPDWKFWCSLDSVVDGQVGWEANKAPLKANYSFAGLDKIVGDRMLSIIQGAALGIDLNEEYAFAYICEKPESIDDPDSYISKEYPDACAKLIAKFGSGEELKNALQDTGKTMRDVKIAINEVRAAMKNRIGRYTESKIKEVGRRKSIVRGEDDAYFDVYDMIEDLVHISKHLSYLSAAKAAMEEHHTTLKYAMEVAKEVADDRMEPDVWKAQFEKAKRRGEI
jgi:hypothetical protein